MLWLDLWSLIVVPGPTQRFIQVHVLLVYTPPFVLVVGLDTQHMATILMLVYADYSH